MATYYLAVQTSRWCTDGRVGLAAQGSNITAVQPGTKLILAVAMGQNGKDTTGASFKLQISSGGGYTDVSDTSKIAWSTSSAEARPILSPIRSTDRVRI